MVRWRCAGGALRWVRSAHGCADSRMWEDPAAGRRTRSDAAARGPLISPADIGTAPEDWAAAPGGAKRTPTPGDGHFRPMPRGHARGARYRRRAELRWRAARVRRSAGCGPPGRGCHDLPASDLALGNGSDHAHRMAGGEGRQLVVAHGARGRRRGSKSIEIALHPRRNVDVEFP